MQTRTETAVFYPALSPLTRVIAKCNFRGESVGIANLVADDMVADPKRTGIMLFLALTLAVGACAPRIAIRGHLPREEQLAKIEIGKQNRNEVAEILGTPSTLGTFEDTVWYYISRKIEKVAFLEEEVLDQRVIAIYFSDRNVVQAIHRYDKEDLRRIETVERTTPTAGRELSVIDQLIGNLGRFGRN